jgi:hypothetical protein
MRRIGLSKASHSKTVPSAAPHLSPPAPQPPTETPVFFVSEENANEEPQQDASKRHKPDEQPAEEPAPQREPGPEAEKADTHEVARCHEAAAAQRCSGARLPSLSRAWHDVLAAM